MSNTEKAFNEAGLKNGNTDEASRETAQVNSTKEASNKTTQMNDTEEAPSKTRQTNSPEEAPSKPKPSHDPEEASSDKAKHRKNKAKRKSRQKHPAEEGPNKARTESEEEEDSPKDAADLASNRQDKNLDDHSQWKGAALALNTPDEKSPRAAGDAPRGDKAQNGAKRSSQNGGKGQGDELQLKQKKRPVQAGSDLKGTEKESAKTGSTTTQPPNQDPPPKKEETACCCPKIVRYQVCVLLLTFFVYVSYHLSRKPLSVVKNSLHQNCSSLGEQENSLDAGTTHPPNDTTWCDWAPFETDDYEHLFGWLDVGFLGTYAACMFVSGYVAERMNLRYFLTIGMLCTGISVAMFGVGYFIQIHNFYFYLAMQIIAGAFQSTGWPAVVATVGNWFGPGRRGAIMGLWNSHTSVGNILGALIGGVWANGPWGWSFIVPGIIIGSLGVVVFFFLVPYPEDVGIEVHNTRIDSDVEQQEAGNGSTNNLTGEESPLLTSGGEDEHAAISICRALRLPGVVEFSLCLFFAKLVSYTFLFWLPKYIGSTTDFSPEKAADLSTLFDVGGVVGGFVAGTVTDINLSPACNCVALLILGTPMLFVYQAYGSVSYAGSIVLLLVCGAFVNGPYALITTAVSADLGTQPALKGNKKALATVTSIIDGTGSIGAALGPLLTGWISPTGWRNVFYMLITANILAALFLVRIVIKEVREMRCCHPREEEIVIDPPDMLPPSQHLEHTNKTAANKM